MKILFLGDIFGKAGRDIINRELPLLKQKYNLDYVIANAENCTHGKGLNWEHYHFLKNAGVNFFTMGNHTWAKKEITEILSKQNDIIRPLNLDSSFQHSNLGLGTAIVKIKNATVRITNLLGLSVALPFSITNPFHELERIISSEIKTDLHIVDFHAETTSEKNAFGIYFDGKVNAILGTHTHVPTSDFIITFRNTVYCTDVGMCGPGYGSVIGARAENAIGRFLNENQQFKLEVSSIGAQLNGVLMEFDDHSHKPIKVDQIRIIKQDKDKYLAWKYHNPYLKNNR
ncbi:TIGR00282 family metallophosphoesterase [[Mycoplasma] testudinis]|uniref:TIGR00282 family metallophosphoesterase n=1 Tax=[Mycoplasma] testudinis TaxID=33924 RepID=UPI000483044B|nr:TIGR00282 family metallophosphoesterase [[Mycoplasma] testudinis]